MKPVSVDVVSLVLSSSNHCSHCQVFIDQVGIGGQIHQEDMDSFPHDLQEEYMRLSDIVLSLVKRYGHQVRFRIIDVQTPEGMVKSLRHWIRQYPTFIVGGKDKLVGWDTDRLDALIAQHLASA